MVHYPSSIYVNQEPTAIIINHPDLIVHPAPIVFHKPAAVVQNPNYRPDRNMDSSAGQQQHRSSKKVKTKINESRILEQHKSKSKDFKSISYNSQENDSFNSNQEIIKVKESTTTYDYSNQQPRYGPRILSSYDFNQPAIHKKCQNQQTHTETQKENSFFQRKFEDHHKNAIKHHKPKNVNENSNKITHRQHVKFNQNQKKLEEQKIFDRKLYEENFNDAKKPTNENRKYLMYSNVKDVEKIAMPPKVNVYHGDKAININTKLLPPYFESAKKLFSQTEPASLPPNEEYSQYIHFDRNNKIKEKFIQSSEIKSQFARNNNYDRQHRPKVIEESKLQMRKKMENSESSSSFDQQYVPTRQLSHKKIADYTSNRNYQTTLQSSTKQYFKNDIETPSSSSEINNNFAYENYFNHHENIQSKDLEQIPYENIPQNYVEYLPENYNKNVEDTTYQNDIPTNIEETPIIQIDTAAASNNHPMVYYGNDYY